MKANEQAPRILRGDYRPPAYLVKTIHLEFDIQDVATRVVSTANYVRNPTGGGQTRLTLMGAELKLLRIALDGRELASADYTLQDEILHIDNALEAFTLRVETELDPKGNTALEGLYASGPMLCTQCEAEGFRRITYYPDRPDVMAVFTTTIEADKALYPILLSNGNRIKVEDKGTRARVTWHDPFPKPCYLFALVAGNLARIEDRFATASGRAVLLEIYCEHGKEGQLAVAMDSLKRSMAWDEKRFGREYDLDIFMIVATSFFNSGAMENKGLNIFNAAYVLGRPETATDRDLQGIEAVVAHEYFHNWSGNRVTCRDWFQLSLKEGFTVFREQEFCRDANSPVTERIDHVRLLRNHQFPEDAGPMAHPVRPDSYMTIDNFYTTTIYEKGSEVVRMLQTLFGIEGFRRGSDLYFARHDGEAVTCDDFVQAIFDANAERRDISIDQFKLWYSQAGTPRVALSGSYDADARSFRLTARQSVPATPGQDAKQPMVIPIAAALLDSKGRDVQGTARTLVLKEAEQEFLFENVPERPVPSLFRHFSAPVIAQYDYSDDELIFLARHDGDFFNRWEALQKLAEKELKRLIAVARAGQSPAPSSAILPAFAELLEDFEADPDFTALALLLPGKIELGQMLLRDGQKIDVDAVHAARDALRLMLARQLKDAFTRIYEETAKAPPLALDGRAIAARALKNTCLGYLGLLDTPETDAMAWRQFEDAQNMTDAVGALTTLARRKGALRDKAFAAFYEKWQGEDLVVDKWFGLQAGADVPGILDEVKRLMEHPAFTFTNPNKIYALVGSFCANLPHFHARDGSGYHFLADVIIRLDALNPQVAGRRVQPLARWRDYDGARAGLMRAQLERIVNQPSLSKNTAEVAQAGLAV